MVKAELDYNPYLLETNIKFNGREPRVNSLVEKYQKEILQSWIKKVPSIFYNEMNGYNFELEFSGTKLDYEDIKKVFWDIKIGEGSVQLFHKNELDNRYKKIEQIKQLMLWLEKNRNSRFDYEKFCSENEEILENSYDYFIVQGEHLEQTAIENINCLFQNMDSVSGLNTDLTNIPILFCINKETEQDIYDDLKLILKRSDIVQEQLFFMIMSPLNLEVVKRTIKDLGVVSPQIVTTINDKKVKRYLETYPITDYIFKVVKIFEKSISVIVDELNQENEKRKILNQDTTIDDLNDVISKLNTSIKKFEKKDNFKMSEALEVGKKEFEKHVTTWKDRKIKTTKRNEAERMATAFCNDVKNYADNFNKKYVKVVEEECDRIKEEFENWYYLPTGEEKYSYPGDFSSCNLKPIPIFSTELLNKCSDNKKKSLVGKTDEKLYNYTEWRTYVCKQVDKVVDQFIEDNKIRLENYYKKAANWDKDTLESMRNKYINKKKEISEQLSDDAKQLQIDNDWLAMFEEKLRMIKRG